MSWATNLLTLIVLILSIWIGLRLIARQDRKIQTRLEEAIQDKSFKKEVENGRKSTKPNRTNRGAGVRDIGSKNEGVSEGSSELPIQSSSNTEQPKQQFKFNESIN